jgi:hypothetical protein
MKVRCIQLFDSAGKPRLQKDSWVTLGKTYHVLEIVQDQSRWLLRLIGDNELNGPAVFRLEQFEIVTPNIPSSWIVTRDKDDSIKLRPERWNQPGFWERYYDKDPEAIRIFEEERRKIIENDP